jgi:hypothetical protein
MKTIKAIIKRVMIIYIFSLGKYNKKNKPNQNTEKEKEKEKKEETSGFMSLMRITITKRKDKI